MKIDNRPGVSASEWDQNGSRVAHHADEVGESSLCRDDKPKDRLAGIESDITPQMTDEEKLDAVTARVLRQYRRAFEELAK